MCCKYIRVSNSGMGAADVCYPYGYFFKIRVQMQLVPQRDSGLLVTRDAVIHASECVDLVVGDIKFARFAVICRIMFDSAGST